MVNAFINGLDNGAKLTQQIHDDITLEGTIDTLEGRAAVEGILTNWKNGLKETSWKFNKGNCKVLHLCWKYPMQLNKLETTHRKAAWKKMACDAGGLEVECESAVRSCGGRTQCLLGYIGKSSASSLREVILPCCWAL